MDLFFISSAAWMWKTGLFENFNIWTTRSGGELMCNHYFKLLNWKHLLKVISGQEGVLKPSIIFTNKDSLHRTVVITTTNEMLDKSWAGRSVQSQTSRSFLSMWKKQFSKFGVNIKLYYTKFGLKRNYVHYYCNHNGSSLHEEMGKRDQLIPNCVFLCKAAKNVR